MKKDAVIAGTGDTIIGLMAQLTEQSFLELNRIKGRTEKPYVILIGSAKIVPLFAASYSAEVQKLMDQCWPGPLTLLLPVKKDLPDYLTGGKTTIALRVPHHAGLLQLLSYFPGLFSTSANKAGAPVAQSINELDLFIQASVSALVMDEQGAGQASTILDCSSHEIAVVREGAYPISQIEKIIGKPFKHLA